MKRISALFLTFIVILGSIGAVSAVNINNTTNNTVGNNGNSITTSGNGSTKNTINNNVITPSVVNSTNANWTTNNYDPTMSRNSPQTIINTTNVNQLIEKWIIHVHNGSTIENPPLIVGQKCYVQNNLMQIFALNLSTGKIIWTYDPHVKNSESAHGIVDQNSIIYAPTGINGTVIALNSTNGKLIWQSPLIDSQKYYYNPSPPIIWNNYIIVGGGGGDSPPLKGSVTCLNKTTGKIIWHITTTVGPWVQGSNASVNGGGAVWTGGAVDQNQGIIYLPVGNPSPDYNASAREGNTSYTDCMIAVNITNGHIIWATPFIQVGTVLNVTPPDTHDWDTSWGSQLVSVQTNNGTIKLVIGHDKSGNIIAMNATNGKPLWWYNLATILYSPGTINHFWNYAANDNDTLYVQDSSNTKGTIAAINLLTGKLKWNITTNVVVMSPLVTNCILFAGNGSDVIMALNKSSGHLLWQFNVGATIGQGGPSIGQGMLLVPTQAGYIVAFELNDPPINQNDPINPTDLTNSTNTTNTSKSIKDNISKLVNNNFNILNNNTGKTTVPMQDTGAPLIPLVLGLSSLITGLIATKRK